MSLNKKNIISICTLGTATRDTIVRMAPLSLERMILRNANQNWLLLEAGRKVEADYIQAFTGGSAINSAVNFKRQGMSAKIIAKIGSDLEATFIKESLTAENIIIDALIVSKNKPTARSVIVVAADNNPTILVDRGANSFMKIEEVRNEDIINCNVLYIGSLSDKSAAVAPWAAKLASINKAIVFFNPGIRQITRYAKAVKSMLPYVSYLSINSIEAQCLASSFFDGITAEKLPSGIMKTWLNKHSINLFGQKITFWQIAKQLIKFGTMQVIITHGEYGVFTMNKDGKSWYCSSLKAKNLVSTIGAGDAFNSTFCAYILKDTPMVKTLQLASIQAVSVIKHLNTQQGLMDKQVLESVWQEDNSKIKVVSQNLPV